MGFFVNGVVCVRLWEFGKWMQFGLYGCFRKLLRGHFYSEVDLFGFDGDFNILGETKLVVCTNAHVAFYLGNFVTWATGLFVCVCQRILDTGKYALQ